MSMMDKTVLKMPITPTYTIFHAVLPSCRHIGDVSDQFRLYSGLLREFASMLQAFSRRLDHIMATPCDLPRISHKCGIHVRGPRVPHGEKTLFSLLCTEYIEEGLLW